MRLWMSGTMRLRHYGHALRGEDAGGPCPAAADDLLPLSAASRFLNNTPHSTHHNPMFLLHKARLTVDAGSVEAVKRDYGPITVQFVLPGKPSGEVEMVGGRGTPNQHNCWAWRRLCCQAKPLPSFHTNLGPRGDAGASDALVSKHPETPWLSTLSLPASGLDVRYMKILKQEKNYNPARWFRVVAVANSYQIRPHWL